MADEVWSMSINTHYGRIEFVLVVTKSRSGTIPNQKIKLELGNAVEVDTSRDIA